MAKYQKAIDILACADDVRSGKIKLQCGQWIKLGPDNPRLSRFHHANTYSICAFHHPRTTDDFVTFSRALNGLKGQHV